MSSPRPPTVLVDATDIHRPSGGRTAVLELFRALFTREAEDDSAWRYLVLASQREPGFDLPHVRQVILPLGRLFGGGGKRSLERLYVQALVSRLTFSRQVDIVHFARSLGGFSRPARNVLTVFDLTTVLHPELHARAAVLYWRHVVPLHLRWADRVVAISQDVAGGLVQHYHLPPSKLDVVYCAPQSVFERPVTPDLIQQVRHRHQLPPNYLLFLGILAKKKNLLTPIRALHQLKSEGIQAPPLILAGRRYRQSDDSAILAEIHSLGLGEDVRYLGPVALEDLPGLYGGACALLFPSLHEGFGIPCIEAMKCGVPVVAARSGAIPEVTADAALLVDEPTDAGAFAEAIRSVLENEGLRQALITRGLARAAEFSWTRSADQVRALYRRLLVRGQAG
jgi:glycosyltransferase involved in cell wall biosynthesis